MEVEWSESKNLENRQKHGISFDEAGRLFTTGVDYLEVYDEAHSDFEDRFIAIGPIARGMILVVWTEREDDVIRIISARWAGKREIAMYHLHRGRKR